jgi:hypothetical protein
MNLADKTTTAQSHPVVLGIFPLRINVQTAWVKMWGFGAIARQRLTIVSLLGLP